MPVASVLRQSPVEPRRVGSVKVYVFPDVDCALTVLDPAALLNSIEPAAVLEFPRASELPPCIASVPGIVVATPALPMVIVPFVPLAVPTSIVRLPELPPVALPVLIERP